MDCLCVESKNGGMNRVVVMLLAVILFVSMSVSVEATVINVPEDQATLTAANTGDIIHVIGWYTY